MLTAALSLAALCAPTAFADTPTTSPAPSTTTTTPAPTTTATPPAPSTSSAPSSTTQPTTHGSTPYPTSPSAPGYEPMTVSAAIPGGPYLIGQDVPLKVTITNSGTAAATDVHAFSYNVSGSNFTITDWKGLQQTSPTAPGIELQPGSHIFDLTLQITRWTGSTAKFQLMFEGKNIFATLSNPVSVPVVDPNKTSTVTGVVFGDRNGNGAADPGEGLAGGTVTLDGPAYSEPVRTTTDSTGHYIFEHVPTGRYFVSAYPLPDGWVMPTSPIELDIDGSGKVVQSDIRAVRPLSDRLAATLAFDRDTYRPGDTVHVHVTLTNKGGTPISGITANCNRAGPANWSVNGPFNWGDITSRQGTTVNPGETRTFDGTGTVPQHADDFGFVELGCDFGNPEQLGNPTAIARVPGQLGSSPGTIYNDKNGNHQQDPGEEIAGAKVGLIDVLSGKVVARQISDKSGRVKFDGVPAGLYEVRVFGPWAPEAGKAFVVPVVRGGWFSWNLALKPGPNVPDTDSVPPTPVSQLPIKDIMATHPTAAPAKPAGLASTGANVIGLSIAGLATLAIGAGVVLYARRRRALG